MRWSTRKFAKDILHTCKICNVPLKKAIKILGGRYCPMIKIQEIYDPLTMGKDIDRDGDERVKFSCGPYYDDMVDLWKDAETEENLRRIKAVKKWFKDNGYL